MDTISDYIGWYGGFSMTAHPFCEIDNLVLCQVAYLKLPKPKIGGPLRESIEAIPNLGEASQGLSDETALYTKIAASKRFGELILSDYEEHFEEEEFAQFAAMTFRLPDSSIYIAYRGTDNTLVGWKEDFMISYTHTKAQGYAVSYLTKQLETLQQNEQVFVGGHSKGGNLALYAAAHCPEELAKKITRVFCNDGPGLCGEVCDLSRLKSIEEKLTLIRPAYAVFGRLFEPSAKKDIIVQSTAEGIMQHSLSSWGISHGALLTADRFLPGSNFVNDVLDRWIESVDDHDRRKFVDDFYETITKDGVQTINDFAKKGPESMERLLVRLTDTDPDVRRTVFKLPLGAVTDEIPEDEAVGRAVETVKKRPYLRDLLMIAGGVLLLLLPEYVLSGFAGVALFLIVAFEVFITLRSLKRSGWDFEAQSTRIVISIILLAVYSMLLVKPSALFLIGSGIFGAGFLVFAYQSMMTFRKTKDDKTVRVKSLIEAVIYFILGCFILVAPQDTVTWYAISVGIILIANGIANLLLDRRKNNDKNGQ